MSIRELRNENGLTISELSDATRIDVKRLKIIERGLERPSAHEMNVISRYFKLDDNAQKRIVRTAKLKSNIIGEGYVTAKPDGIVVRPPAVARLKNKISVLDLFAGIGGISYGFEQTGMFQTIAGLDLLKDRVATFQNNHNSAYGFVSDITKFHPQELEKHLGCKPNVIVGGAPCQGFSSIRPFRTLTENDKRNNLFQVFANYIDYFKPDWFVFENVVGLLSHKNGRTLNVLLTEFRKLGYNIDFKVLNAAYYGVPQLRERLIIVGNRLGVDFSWPAPTHFFKHKSMAGTDRDYVLVPDQQETIPAVTVLDAISDLPPLATGETKTRYGSIQPLNSYQVYCRLGSEELMNHDATVHSEKMMKIIRASSYNIDAVRHLVSSGFSSCYSRLEPDRPSVTLTVNFVNPSSNKCIHPVQNRALTPREGARIQGFPDTFRFSGSRTQIVKQIGNAVPPILSKIIAEKIFTYY